MRISCTLSHLTSAALPWRVCTAVLGNSLEVMLSLGHCSYGCFSSLSKPPISRQKTVKQDFKATTEGLYFYGNFVNKDQLIGKV